MFRRPKDRGSTPGRTRKTLNLDPLECIDLLDDVGAADAARPVAATVVPDQDSLDRSSCAGRCLCLCQCHFSTDETGAATQGKKSKTGFIGTIRRKLGLRKKAVDVENHSASPSPKSRIRSLDRAVTHARTLPRSWKAVPSYGADRSVAIRVDLMTDDGCATTSRAKCSKHKSSVQGDRTALPLVKPCRSEKNDKSGTKFSRSSHLVASAAELLSDDESKELLIHDTGYGHASAPVFNSCDLSLIDSGSCVEKEDGSVACETDSPQTVPLIPPVYDQVKEPSNGWSLTKELFKLPKYGWYWGPISRAEAEEKLNNQPDGSFLLRDSSDERYLLSLSFRSYGRTLHTRIEHCNGLFSFYAQTESEGYSSIVDLIEHSMSDSQSGVFCYSRARTPGSPSFPVRLAKPVSRFTQVRSLQYLCRFVIRQYTRVDYIQRLPLPTSIKGWLEETQY